MLNDSDPGNQNAYLVKRNTGGGSQLSRDPLNLVNKHSFKVIQRIEWALDGKQSMR